ncbi:MarR family winged helix-turn-helix transcriptional regulator [Lutibacter citreus]|uniref:MarR family winged helix-turn-helix transcriptional regulator n=1 Tax=Lutibacter citreus TaxID=2138210 RepID=UPI000DBE132B|nr:MarR family transcriptional regulator [Lutibacter citreus]
MAEFSKEINSEFKNEHIKAFLNLKFTANYFENIENMMFKPFKISSQQYNILRILRGAKKAITVKTVKERMVQKSPNATRLMDKLCDKGLIVRTRCENDRRVVYVQINEKGLELLNKIKVDNFNGNFSNLSDEEAKLLNNLLDKFRNNENKNI